MFLIGFSYIPQNRRREITSVCTANHILEMPEFTFFKSKILIHFQNYKHSGGKVYTLTIKSCNFLKYCSVGALENYLKMRGSNDGPLFCYPLTLKSQGKSFQTY